MNWIKEYYENEFNWIPEMKYLREGCHCKAKEFDFDLDSYDTTPLMADYIKWKTNRENTNYRSDLITSLWQRENVGYDTVDYAQMDDYSFDECLEDFDSFRYLSGTHPQDNPDTHFVMIFNSLMSPKEHKEPLKKEYPAVVELYVEFWEWNKFNDYLFSSNKKAYANHNANKQLKCSFACWCAMKVDYIQQSVLELEIERIQREADAKIWDRKKKSGFIPEHLIAPEPEGGGDENLPF